MALDDRVYFALALCMELQGYGEPILIVPHNLPSTPKGDRARDVPCSFMQSASAKDTLSSRGTSGVA
ncbi:hypothetical protein N7465_007398 [Penicillium sp. CMV-2018d]|nr:hypothetical protein N7465_007398 [Penicillium sp. CMV-2018d]